MVDSDLSSGDLWAIEIGLDRTKQRLQALLTDHNSDEVKEIMARERAEQKGVAPARPEGNHAAAINELALSVVRKRGPEGPTG